jgi:hypothetical protein
MSEGDYILFYSNRCLHSKELLNLLYKDVELNQKFTKILRRAFGDPSARFGFIGGYSLVQRSQWIG